MENTGQICWGDGNRALIFRDSVVTIHKPYNLILWSFQTDAIYRISSASKVAPVNDSLEIIRCAIISKIILFYLRSPWLGGLYPE